MSQMYICKEPFSIEAHDENGFYTGIEMTVQVGAMFERDDSSFRMIGSSDTVRLIGITADEGTWLEITEERLVEHFEECSK